MRDVDMLLGHCESTTPVDAPRGQSDLRLVEAVAREEPGAQDELLERTRSIVESCLHSTVARSPSLREEALDLRQRFHVMLMENDFRVLRSFAGRSSLTTWIHVIASRFFYRASGALKARQMSSLEHAREVADSAESPEAQHARREEASRLRRAISGLSAEERVLLALLYEEDLTGPEVGRLLGLTARRRGHHDRDRSPRRSPGHSLRRSSAALRSRRVQIWKSAR